MMNPRARQSGFTLIEVIIALGLLAFTLLGIFQMQFYAMRGNTLSLGGTTALHIVQDRLEALLAEPFNGAQLVDAVAGNPIDSTALTDYSWAVTDARGQTYTLVTNITDNVGALGVVDTKTIRVIALWGPGNARQCGITTVLREG